MNTVPSRKAVGTYYFHLDDIEFIWECYPDTLCYLGRGIIVFAKTEDVGHCFGVDWCPGPSLGRNSEQAVEETGQKT